MEKIEKRTFKCEQVEIREGDDGKKTIRMTVPYNSWSDDLGGFKERILPGFFSDSIVNRDIRSYWNHNSDFVLGRSGNGTLEFKDHKGFLEILATPPDTQWGRDAITSVEGGYVDGASFAFRAIDQNWNDDNTKRELIRGEVYEFSPVAMPAYPKSAAQARSILGIALDDVIQGVEARSAGQDISEKSQEALIALRDALNDFLDEGKKDEPQERDCRDAEILGKTYDAITRSLT